jgi:hypothetical protein
MKRLTDREIVENITKLQPANYFFQSLIVIVRPAHGFKFDMPDLNDFDNRFSNITQGCTTQVPWRTKFFCHVQRAKMYMFLHIRMMFSKKETIDVSNNLGFAGQIKSLRVPFVVHVCSKDLRLLK